MSSTVNPTRQQLEELDALLQRMLSLPLIQPDPELSPQASASPRFTAPAAPPRRRAEPPSGDNAWNVPLPATGAPPVLNGWPSGIDSLSVSATSTVTPRPAPARLRVAAVAPPNEQLHTREAQTQRLRVEPPPAMTIPIPPPRPPLSVPSTEPSLPFFLWPLGAIDRSMGNVFAGFGAPGRWLGHGGGKVFFGWCGLLALVAAAAWGVMDYLGWSW
jgi:hypothetical protein